MVNPLMLEGVFPPIPTLFDSRGKLDTTALSTNLKWWQSFALAGFVILGSNGEAVLLETEEKLRLIDAAREAIAEDRVMVVGTGQQSTQGTIRLTQAAGSAGADYALVLPPFYYRGLMNDDVLERHFHDVADASPIPVILYNMPACTGIDLGGELIVRLAGHENIVGLKDSGGDLGKLGFVHLELGEGFRILAGSASFFLPALTVGAVGGVLALANIAPEQCIGIQRAVRSGEMQEATHMQIRLIPPNTAITRRWGVPGLKAALEMLGQHGGPVRNPLLPLGEAARVELRSILVRAGILGWQRKEMTI